MGCKAGRRNKTSTPGIFIKIASLEGWPTKAKEIPSLHEIRLTPAQYFYISGGEYVKGAVSWNLSFGRSANIWTPIFTLSLQQLTQLKATDFVMELALIIQKPLSLISFKVMPPPQCAALRWHHLTINSITLDFFRRIIEYINSNSNLNLAILNLLIQWNPCCLSVLPSFVWFFVIFESSASKYRLQLFKIFPSLIFFLPVVTVGLVQW